MLPGPAHKNIAELAQPRPEKHNRTAIICIVLNSFGCDSCPTSFIRSMPNWPASTHTGTAKLCTWLYIRVSLPVPGLDRKAEPCGCLLLLWFIVLCTRQAMPPRCRLCDACQPCMASLEQSHHSTINVYVSLPCTRHQWPLQLLSKPLYVGSA